MYQKRTYRQLVEVDRLMAFEVTVKETDLLIHARKDLGPIAREIVLERRRHLETYIEQHPDFAATLQPWPAVGPAPALVADMVAASTEAGVGPMAAVAGAMAQQVGTALLAHTDEIIVENGGDIFIQTRQDVCAGIFAGRSALSLRFGLRIPARNQPLAVCTSSGTIGHSLSLGRADAVCVVSKSAALADAAATALANRVRSAADINAAIEYGRRMPNIDGLVMIVDEQIGCWGTVELAPLAEKKVEF
jgi:ApbE superfamily uncharacterized protein (UPF0280 family)